MIDDAQQASAELMGNANNYLNDTQQTVEQLMREAKSASQHLLDTTRESAQSESRQLIDSATRQAQAIQEAAMQYRDQAVAAVAHHRTVLQDLNERISALREQWAQSHMAITEQVARAGTHFAQAENRASELVAVLNEKQEEFTNSLSSIMGGIQVNTVNQVEQSEQSE
jgi:hypothetical protein